MSRSSPLRRLLALGSAATLLALAGAPAVTAAQGSGTGGLTTHLEKTAEAAVTLLDMPTTTTPLATRVETIQGVTYVIGLSPQSSASPSYADSPSALPGYGAIEAAVADGLMAGWAQTTGDFDPSGPMTRTDLAILATNALGLDTEASDLIDDTKTYEYLYDLLLAGYNLGFANEMMKEGVVPPEDDARYAPNAKVSQPVLDVTLYRMWLQYDLPFTATLAAQSPNTLAGHADALTLTPLNALGTGIPPVNFSRYSVAYSVQGANAGLASVAGGAFSATAPGQYTVAATITGPLMQAPLTADTTIDVTAPAPIAPAAPPGPTATEVGTFDDQQGGIQVRWSPVAGATGYELLYSDNGAPYAEVPDTYDDGPLGAAATEATVLGQNWYTLGLGTLDASPFLHAGDTYTFEVVASLPGGTTQTSAATNPAVYGAPPVTDLRYYEPSGDDFGLEWTPGGGHTTGYEIWVVTEDDTWTEIPAAMYGGPLPGSASSFAIPYTVLAQYDYPEEWAVVAVDADGNGSPVIWVNEG